MTDVANIIRIFDLNEGFKAAVKKYGKSLKKKTLKLRIAERDNFTCKLCGLRASFWREEVLTFNPKNSSIRLYGFSPEMKIVPFTLDHIVPRASKGPGIPSNLQLSCEPCNRLKGDRNIYGQDFNQVCGPFNVPPRSADFKRSCTSANEFRAKYALAPT